MHRHIGANMPGYLPVNDPSIVRTKAEAISCMAEDIRAYQDLDCLTHGYDHKPYRQQGRVKDGDVYLEPRACVGGASFHFWFTEPCSCEEGEQEIEEYAA